MEKKVETEAILQKPGLLTTFRRPTMVKVTGFSTAERAYKDQTQ
jgi:hypothetical protein